MGLFSSISDTERSPSLNRQTVSPEEGHSVNKKIALAVAGAALVVGVPVGAAQAADCGPSCGSGSPTNPGGPGAPGDPTMAGWGGFGPWANAPAPVNAPQSGLINNNGGSLVDLRCAVPAANVGVAGGVKVNTKDNQCTTGLNDMSDRHYQTGNGVIPVGTA